MYLLRVKANSWNSRGFLYRSLTFKQEIYFSEIIFVSASFLFICSAEDSGTFMDIFRHPCIKVNGQGNEYNCWDFEAFRLQKLWFRQH